MSKVSIMKKVMEAMEGELNRKVLRSVPVKKEWKALLDDMTKKQAAEKAAESKASTAKALFWATVETDLDEDSSMRINRETNEIEILED